MGLTHVRLPASWCSDHSGGEQSPGQKKYIIGNSYIVGNVYTISETVDEKIWHWGLFEKSAKPRFDDFWVKIRAVLRSNLQRWTGFDFFQPF